MQLFSTIRLKTKTNCDLSIRVFLRFRQLAFDFSLALRDISLLSRKALYRSEVQCKRKLELVLSGAPSDVWL